MNFNDFTYSLEKYIIAAGQHRIHLKNPLARGLLRQVDYASLDNHLCLGRNIVLLEHYTGALDELVSKFWLAGCLEQNLTYDLGIFALSRIQGISTKAKACI
jgi:hypothetical protein